MSSNKERVRMRDVPERPGPPGSHLRVTQNEYLDHRLDEYLDLEMLGQIRYHASGYVYIVPTAKAVLYRLMQAGVRMLSASPPLE
jgi:hypothetical protein